MKKEHETNIIEFEVIAPTGKSEKVGEKFTLNEKGEYVSADGFRHSNLLFLLDHSLHYRVSKITVKGITYVIPIDRKKNYITDIHPEHQKFNIQPLRYNPDSSAGMDEDDNGRYVEYEVVKHLF